MGAAHRPTVFAGSAVGGQVQAVDADLGNILDDLLDRPHIADRPCTARTPVQRHLGEIVHRGRLFAIGRLMAIFAPGLAFGLLALLVGDAKTRRLPIVFLLELLDTLLELVELLSDVAQLLEKLLAAGTIRIYVALTLAHVELFDLYLPGTSF